MVAGGWRMRQILEPVISHDCEAGWRTVVPGLSRPCECRFRALEVP